MTDMSDLPLTDAIRRAVRAVARRQNVLFEGSHHVGAISVARRLPGIMPEPSDHASRWIAAEHEGLKGVMRVRSAAAREFVRTERPFRAPHHTASVAALVGDAAGRYPGEVQLARFGVLLLDELPEFGCATLDALRGALRRMTGRPLIVATARSCPCGRRGLDRHACACTEAAIGAWDDRVHDALCRVGGPFARIATSVTMSDLRGRRHGTRAPTSAECRAAVLQAWGQS